MSQVTHIESFNRFYKRNLVKLPFQLQKDDYVIVCGDFGLCWAQDVTYDYVCEWFQTVPFTILWVDGNHENYDMLKGYSVSMWNGGKVQHIIKNKVIRLMRGQIFSIDGLKIFTFGGASSHDIQGGIFDRKSPAFRADIKAATKKGLPYRVIHETWWKEELPSDEEMQEGLANLERVNYSVDYVISHCGSNSFQDTLMHHYLKSYNEQIEFKTDKLTDYFDGLESKLKYKQWYLGHYHDNVSVDSNHTLLYNRILPIGSVF